MFRKILVPVDLAHLDSLERALDVAAEMSKQHDSPIVYVGVTGTEPTEVARTPEEHAEKMEEFARRQSHKYTLHGAEGLSRVSHDRAVELDSVLMKTIEETGADLVIMASHRPGLLEHVFPSNAGYLASHAKVSVFVVR